RKDKHVAVGIELDNLGIGHALQQRDLVVAGKSRVNFQRNVANGGEARVVPAGNALESEQAFIAAFGIEIIADIEKVERGAGAQHAFGQRHDRIERLELVRDVLVTDEISQTPARGFAPGQQLLQFRIEQHTLQRFDETKQA